MYKRQRFERALRSTRGGVAPTATRVGGRNGDAFGRVVGGLLRACRAGLSERGDESTGVPTPNAVGGAARHVVVWHCTMLVNSAAHAPAGHKPYGARGLAVQSGVVSLLAWGEGWHDWHHLFPYDSAAAERHWLIQFNPTYAFLDACELLRLVSGRKRALHAWNRKRADMQQ